MSGLNVERAGFQCPECGVPIDAVERAAEGVRLEPCGHALSAQSERAEVER